MRWKQWIVVAVRCSAEKQQRIEASRTRQMYWNEIEDKWFLWTDEVVLKTPWKRESELANTVHHWSEGQHAWAALPAAAR